MTKTARCYIHVEIQRIIAINTNTTMNTNEYLEEIDSIKSLLSDPDLNNGFTKYTLGNNLKLSPNGDSFRKKLKRLMELKIVEKNSNWEYSFMKPNINLINQVNTNQNNIIMNNSKLEVPYWSLRRQLIPFKNFMIHMSIDPFLKNKWLKH